MAKYIDKSALVAEIQKRRTKHFNSGGSPSSEYCHEDDEIFGIIDTLEVKDVDLERLINDYFTGWYFDNELDILAKPNNYSATVDDVKEIGKHFFELGLFSQLTWKDIKRISEIGEDFMNSEDSDNLNDEEYYTEILNRFKAQKGEEV